MIISHKYKFIFIKTNKTAGTSIEIALSRFCGEEDIITPISPEDEATRRRLGYRGPQNYLAPMSEYRPRDLAKLVLGHKRKRRYYNHISAREIRERIGEDIWRRYYKFCFERNPCERFVSLYYWMNKSEPRPTISEFLESGAAAILRTRGIQLYTMDGEVVVDRVCLYERLGEELEEIRRHLGLPEPLELPHAKSSHRTDKRSHRDILNEAQIQQIRVMFDREVALFGYGGSTAVDPASAREMATGST